MYDRRIKIFVILIASLLLVCLLRLTQMQLLPDSSLQDEIAKLKRQKGLNRQLNTIRGKIFDRKGEVLAADELQFKLLINYKLTSCMDERVQKAKLLTAAKKDNPEIAISEVRQELQTGREDLQQIIDKCTYFGLDRAAIENKIRRTNNKIWNLRKYLAWKRDYPDRDFAQAVPDANERLLLTARVDIAEMHKSWPLLQLETDDDILAAQVEFMNVDGIRILPEGHRFYPYGSAAAQTIGWVGPATQEQDRKLFENDKLSSYLLGEVCGREDGVEYVCETILRGRRGQEVYDIDRQLINRTEIQFGEDVSLTLDIELQQKIEDHLADCERNPNNCNAPTAAVVLDVATGDILALVSMPSFDLNRARYDYSDLNNDLNEPLRNRAINKQYPPGSAIKPLILIAGLESGKISPGEVISCPAEPAPQGWPSCWIYNRFKSGHDYKWQNNARNAIKGSCNIYFSQLANRIDPQLLQQWLSKFGYGRISSLVARDPSLDLQNTEHKARELRQEPGIISSGGRQGKIRPQERRYFGIGQGNLRVTPLQAANAFAAIARGGVWKPPLLFIEDPNNSKLKTQNSKLESAALGTPVPPPVQGISPQTLDVVRDGMSAVVNESGGTANRQFAPFLAGLAEQDVKVYGKTGSTENPDNAWFAGFAEDGTGRSISIAVVVEGGQHGSSDAAPLARDIIQLCIDAGHIGKNPLATNQGP